MAIKTKKSFDAVRESRRWRRATGKKLRAMTDTEKIAYLNRHLTAIPGANKWPQAPNTIRSP